MMMEKDMKKKVRISSPTKEGLAAAIKRSLYCISITLHDDGKISNAKGVMGDYEWREKGGRFQMIELNPA